MPLFGKKTQKTLTEAHNDLQKYNQVRLDAVGTMKDAAIALEINTFSSNTEKETTLGNYKKAYKAYQNNIKDLDLSFDLCIKYLSNDPNNQETFEKYTLMSQKFQKEKDVIKESRDQLLGKSK